MISYTDYVRLCSKFGESRANSLFPRTIAALRRSAEGRARLERGEED